MATSKKPLTAEEAAKVKARKERREKALEMKIVGFPISHIAKELKISVPQVHKDLRKVLTAPIESVEHSRAILIRRHERELFRLDRAMAYITKAMDDAATNTDSKLMLETTSKLAKMSATRGKHMESIAGLTVPARVQAIVAHVGGSNNHPNGRIDLRDLSADELTAIASDSGYEITGILSPPSRAGSDSGVSEATIVEDDAAIGPDPAPESEDEEPSAPSSANGAV